MSFRAILSCPADAEYCEFLIIQFSNGRDVGTTSQSLKPKETTTINADEETRYVGVKNGSARGLEQQSRSLLGGVNETFIDGK